jgi:phospholipid/cholesterol/gamma-HCH transport system substrate-binding protein
VTTRRSRVASAALAATLAATSLAACAIPGTGGAGHVTAIAYFSDVNALEHHATVEMNGVGVGIVSHIGVSGSLAKLTLSIRKNADVPAGVTAVVRTPTLLGAEVVELQVPPHPSGLLVSGAVIADQAHPGVFEPDLESLVKSGNGLLNTFVAQGGTSALAQVVSEGAQGFGPESGDLRAVLDNLDTVVTSYAGQTQTIDTLLGNLSKFASGVGPDAQANAQALSNLAATTEVLDRQKDRLLQLLAALSTLSSQGSQLLNADLSEITDQLTTLSSLTKGVANQQAALGKVLQFLNGHNLSTSRGVDHNDDFVQVLNDFIICGLPGGGEIVGNPVSSCSAVNP